MKELMNFSLTLNLSEEGERVDVKKRPYSGYKLTLYENGVEIESSYLNKEQWENFKELCKSQSADSFFLGSIRNGDAEKGKFTDYGKMILKNCRFYSRPLNSKEIKLNYDTRLVYDKGDGGY